MTTSPPARLPRVSRATIAELRSVAITGLFVLAVFYTLHFGREFFLPLALALFLAMLLRPVVQLLRRLRIPAALAPALVLAVLLAATVAGLYQAWDPATEWVSRAPSDLRNLEGKVRKLLRPVQTVTRTAQQVDQMADVTGKKETPEVEIKHATITETIFGGAKKVLAAALIVVVLSYFLLASGDQYMRKLPRVLPRAHAEQILVILNETESQISRYLFAVTLINLTVGAITAGIMAGLSMPTPLLLGLVAAALNFIPYFGPLVMMGVLSMVALISFDEPGRALLAPLLYLCVHALETNFITPHLLGRRLPLNPLAIFLGFLFWWWLWGIPGAALAVPIMVTIKVVADKTESLQGLGEFLGR